MTADEYILSSVPKGIRLNLIWLDELWHYERDDDSCFSGTLAEYLTWRISHPAWQSAPITECEVLRESDSLTCSFIHCID